MPSLELWKIFGWIGIVSFGGGLAVVPEMNRQLVLLHGWLDARTFTDGYAIGQLAPGPNFLAVVFYGYALAGTVGAVVALVASFAPGALIATTLGLTWATMNNKPWLSWIRRGLVPVGAGLMAAGVFVLARDTLSRWPLWCVAAVVGVLVDRKVLNHALAVASAGVVGVLFSL